MAEARDLYGRLYQNLVDGGCDQILIEACMNMAREGQWNSLIPLLSRKKSMLLDTVHTNQKQIDCLDFLIYSLKTGKLEG
ncbi:MAG: hypothetical protein HFE73_06730 [Firmicutes bacterium]|nr:hypothetical protein [Bacillota bacterium]